jgi:DNA-binding NtrC family response regulator
MARILIVDDDTDMLHSFRRMLRNEEHEVNTSNSGEAALQRLSNEQYDLVVMDIRMGGISGIETLRRIMKLEIHPFVILMTAYATTETTIEAIKLGAFDYIIKPFEVPEMKDLIHRALETRRVAGQGTDTHAAEASMEDEIVGRSSSMLEVYKLVGRVARQNVAVLITGESGVGKELVARAIHRHSNRVNEIFLPVNCAAIPEHLLESEFFGHERGSFTGAVGRRLGKFEQCDGGTIFLDEVGELAPGVQGKLLRLLEDGKFQRVGGSETVSCDVRIIAATNRDLASEVEKGTFRTDLFYRLNVVHVHLSPLRERREDVALLVDHFLLRLARNHPDGRLQLRPEVLEILRSHTWPGNVRQLENALRKAAATCRGGVIAKDDLPDEILQPGQASALAGTREQRLDAIMDQLADISMSGEGLLSELQKGLIPKVLEKTGGNKLQASKHLGISRNTLRNHLKSKT